MTGDGKNIKIWFLTAHTVIIMFLVVLIANIIGTEGEVLIERYISIKKLLILCAGFTSIYIVSIYLIIRKTEARWEQYLFYISMVTAILVVGILGYFTHGESIRSILANDKNDAMMDFFNSLTYGMKPYANGVIYPPLINVIYGLLGRFCAEVFNGGFAIRAHQMGSLIYGLYVISMYSLCVYLISKIKLGTPREKIGFAVILLFSLPFLFTYDRGNSILLVLLALMTYLSFYKSTVLRKRLLAYNALGIAAGIKISPVIFGLILVRERKWRECAIAVLIVVFWFFAPFILTDGNVFTLIDNISKTDNMFDIKIYNKMIESVGSGAFVNTTSLFAAVERFFNVNVISYGNLLNYFLLAWGMVIVFVAKNIQEWQVWTILVGIMVLMPGFSAVYNLILFTIPLALFLNSKPVKNMQNIIILLCFIGIFIPLVNYPLGIFGVFMTDWHPLVITTLLESVSTLLLVLIVIINGMRDLFSSYKDSKCIYGAVVITAFCVAIFSWNSWQSKSIDSFYNANMKAEQSVSGFLREHGQYLGIKDDEATINLNTKDILRDGLLLSFGRWDGIKADINEDVVVFINNEYVGGSTITGKGNQYIFIPAHDLQDYADLSDVKVTLVRQHINADFLPLLYVGPADPCGKITDGSMLQYSTSGLEHGDSILNADNDIEFLCTTDDLKEGMLLEYIANSNYLEGNLKISINGIEVVTDNVRQLGKNSTYVNFDMLSSDLQEIFAHDGVCEISVKFFPVHTGSGIQESNGLKISYIGVIPKLSAWRNIGVNDGYGHVILPSGDIENGLNVAFNIPDEYSNTTIIMDIWQSGRHLGSYTIYPHENFQGINIEKEYLDTKEKVVDLSFSVRTTDGLQPDLSIDYISTGGIKECVAGDNFAYFNRGLKYDKQAELQYMGNKATFFLLPSHDSEILKLNYNVSEYLLKNSDIDIDVYVNGKKVYAGLPYSLGDNEVEIPLSEDILAINKGCIQVTVLSNRVYNLKRLHLSRLKEMIDDRSIGIKYVGLKK